MLEKYTCIDCGGAILYDSLASGTCGNKPVESWCKCVDRETNKGKKFSIVRKVNFHEYATFIPEYIKK